MSDLLKWSRPLRYEILVSGWTISWILHLRVSSVFVGCVSFMASSAILSCSDLFQFLYYQDLIISTRYWPDFRLRHRIPWAEFSRLQSVALLILVLETRWPNKWRSSLVTNEIPYKFRVMSDDILRCDWWMLAIHSWNSLSSVNITLAEQTSSCCEWPVRHPVTRTVFGKEIRGWFMPVKHSSTKHYTNREAFKRVLKT